MKKILSLSFLSLFASTTLFAEAPRWSTPSALDIQCLTQFPTTSFIGLTDGKKINVQLYNHNGTKYMPIHSGLVTVNDVPLLQKRAEVLKNVGKNVHFSFNLADCRVYEDQTFSCNQGGSFKGDDGKEFQVYSLRSSKTHHVYTGSEYNEIQLDLALIFEGETYYIPMKYQDYECPIAFEFASKLLTKK